MMNSAVKSLDISEQLIKVFFIITFIVQQNYFQIYI